MTKKKPRHVCEHDPQLSEEEENATNWLSQVLGDMSKTCGPDAKRAAVAHAAIGKILEKLHELHDRAHEQDAQIARNEVIMTGMAGLPHQLGLVDKEDLN